MENGAGCPSRENKGRCMCMTMENIEAFSCWSCWKEPWIIAVEGEIGEEQQVFRKGWGTVDGMFALRLQVEKKLEGQDDTAIGFVDLEKGYDTIPREMTIVTLRWMRSHRRMSGWWRRHMRTRRAGVCVDRECWESLKYWPETGSALSPLLFLTVVKLISRNIGTKDYSGNYCTQMTCQW